MSGGGTFEECDIFADASVGMAIWDGGDPLVLRCKIHGNARGGVTVLNGGRGVFEDCEFWGHCGRNFTLRKGAAVRRSSDVER